MTPSAGTPLRREPQDRRLRRWTIALLLASAALTSLAIWLGLSVRHSVLLGVCVLLVVAFLPLTGVPAWVRFRRLPYQRRDGARREVSTLSWALYGNHATLREPAVRRLHEAGTRACQHAGLDLVTATGRSHAVEVLGPATLAFLDDPLAHPVDADRMRAHLTAFDRLDLRNAAR